MTSLPPQPIDRPTGRPASQFFSVAGGTLAYELSGAEGPLVVLAHGMGDSRQAFRFLVPDLVAAGYRVASVDLRGCGESSATWASYTRTEIAADLTALIEHLGGPAVLVGHSIAGGAATIAGATSPDLITAVVHVAPFTRKQQISLRDLRVASYRRGVFFLLGAVLLGSVRSWKRYLEVAYPGPKPADWELRLAQITTMLREPGRKQALQAMGRSAPTDADAQLANVRCPVLIVQGSADPDWVSPQAEGEAILAGLTPGLGRLEMVPDSGHYPHVQHSSQVSRLLLAFIASGGGSARA